MTLDELDRRLLDIVQADFPVVRRPYEELAQRLETTEDDVLARMRRLVDARIIRSIGPVFNLRQLGSVSTLCAARVSRESLDMVAEAINRFDEVTHNYLRDHQFNMWFTLVAPSQEKLDEIFEEIDKTPGIEELISLPAERTFKINVHFPMVDE